MGAGIGFVRDAQNNARQNRDNLKIKRNFEQTHKSKTTNKAYTFKEATPEELAAWKKKFLNQQRRDNLIKNVLAIAIIVMLSLVALWIFT